LAASVESLRDAGAFVPSGVPDGSAKSLLVRFIVREVREMIYAAPSKSSMLRHAGWIRGAIALIPLYALAWSLSAQSADALNTHVDATRDGTEVVETKEVADAEERAVQLFEKAARRARDANAANESSFRRMWAARLQADGAVVAFATRNVTVDVALDAQRRRTEAEVEFIRAVLDAGDATTNAARRALLVMQLKSLEKARDSAIDLCRVAPDSTGNQDVGREVVAQVREQRCLFSSLIEDTLSKIAQVEASGH
jgi:hypothetical protein